MHSSFHGAVGISREIPLRRNIFEFAPPRVALLTGAGSGMGLASARAFALAGASVVLADINEEAVKYAAEQLVRDGHKAITVCCDVSNE